MPSKIKELEKLVKHKVDNEGLLYWRVSWDDKFLNSTPEEKAEAMLETQKAINEGRFVDTTDCIDGAPWWFSQPRLNVEDLIEGGFKYRIWQIKDKVHSFMLKVHMEYLWTFKRGVKRKRKHLCNVAYLEALLTYDLAYYDPVEGMYKPVPEVDKQTIRKMIENYKTKRKRNND